MSVVLQESASQIGRFQLGRCLGRGSQGEVWLAQDPQLRRDVAIKTVAPSALRDESVAKSLLDEAVMVSRLNHPNIVTLYDAGQDGDRPYLVFEYVPGTTLGALIMQKGRIEGWRAAEIAMDCLRGLQFAHEKGIVHRDIKPGNIMISEDQATRIMDFGIAALFSTESDDSDSFLGTPTFMAPEYAATREFTPRSDVFAVGMVLYAMLTGQSAVKGATLSELLQNLIKAQFPPPSALVSEIDPRLDALVVRALSRDPKDRPESARAMADELEAILQPAAVGPVAGVSGTVEFLLRRMQRKTDFPALSTTIGAVSKSTASDKEAIAGLASSILKDFAFTHKLLKLVNTAYYGQFGGTISTISRAIMVMGYDQIRSVAVSLIMFEHLQNKAQADDLKDEVLSAYFSALLARDLMTKAGVRDAEEAFICAMFSRLGRLLVTFYLYDEHQAIKQLTARGTDEPTACDQVLGVSYTDLGMGVARHWNFPDKLIEAMRPLPAGEVLKPHTDVERLRALSELATSLTGVIRDVRPEQRSASLATLVERYGKGLGIGEQHLKTAVQNAVGEISRDAGILNFKTTNSAFFNQAKRWSVEVTAGDSAGKGVDALIAETRVEEGQTIVMSSSQIPVGEARQAALRAGFQDITSALVGDFKLNDVLRIVLETMFRALGFTRTLLFIRDPVSNSLKSRIGFGDGVEAIIRAGFHIPLTPARDVFHAAVSQGADIYIEDVNGERIRDHIPDWYRERIAAQSFALFPIMIAKKPVGLIYGDAAIAKSLQLGADDLAQLKTLRNQAVLAIKSQGT